MEMANIKSSASTTSYFLLLLFFVFSCKSANRVLRQQKCIFSHAASTAWEKDSCGYFNGDRYTIARIFNEYINASETKIKVKKVYDLFGQPNEIRKISDENIRLYYFIGRDGDCKEKEVSTQILDIGLKTNGRLVSGSSIHLWEPEDN
jgi:hypothetical protein